MEKSEILLKPIITERSLKDASLGVYTFMVAKQADKTNIKKVIEEQFKVHIVNISTITMKGKKRTVGRRRTKVLRPNWKKTKVKLTKGEKIALFEAETKG